MIDRIYEAAFDATGWDEALLSFADVMRSEFVVLGIYDPDSGLGGAIAPRTDPASIRSYGEHWAVRNPLWNRTLKCPVGQVFTPQEVLGNGYLERTEIYNEWWAPQGMSSTALATNVLLDGQSSAVASIYRAHSRDSFDSREQELFHHVTRHLSRALELHRRLHRIEMERSEANEVLEGLNQGVALVDVQGRVLFANRKLRDLAEAGDGIVYTDNRIEVSGLPGAVARMVAACSDRSDIRSTASAVGFKSPVDGRCLRMQVSPLPTTVGEGPAEWLGRVRPVGILLVTDPSLEHAESLRAQLRGRFGLTPAETRFALEIMRGDGKRAAGERCGISYATARTHLSSIFSKTGVHRQAELVHLLLKAAGEQA